MDLISAMDLATAYELVAQANHYLVGIVGRDYIGLDDFDAAEQILIERQNASGSKIQIKRLDLALDILAYDRQRKVAL